MNRFIAQNIPAPDLDEVVLVDADRNTVTSPFDDVHRLPLPVVSLSFFAFIRCGLFYSFCFQQISFLKKSLKRKSDLLGDRVSRVFLRASVMLLGGYRDALRLLPGQQITFHDDQFVRSRPTSWRPFLRQMLHLQTFRQFIDQRLQLLNAGSGLDDEFERDLNSASAELGCHNTQFSHQYKHWVSQVKRDGGAVLRSVQPVFRTAYRRLKDQSRRAVHGLRDRMITSDSNHPHHSSSHHHRNHLNPHIRSASSEHLSGIRPDQVPQSLLFGSLSLSSSSQQSSPLSSHGSSFASSLPMPTQNISTKVRSPIRSCSLDLLHLDSSRDLISFHT